MPRVRIQRPGLRNPQDGEVDEWQFTATVDGRVGIINVLQPNTASEDDAAISARLVLEADPSQLEGISSTSLGGGGSSSGGASGGSPGGQSSGGRGSPGGGRGDDDDDDDGEPRMLEA